MSTFPSLQISDLLKRVHQASPFYRRMLNEVRSLTAWDEISYEDYLRIPLTLPSQVNSSSSEFMCSSMNEGGRVFLTSSTSGVHKRLYLSRMDLEDNVRLMTRCFQKVGLQTGTFFMPILSYGHSGATEILRAADRVGLISIPVSSHDAQSALDLLRITGHTTIWCFPTILLSLGRLYSATGLSNVKSLIVSSELSTDATRTEIAGLWKTQAITEVYGTVETTILGFQSPTCKALHIDNADDQATDFDHATPFVELVNPITNLPAAEFEVGEVVVTTFRECMPLIRYKVGDLALRLPSRCSCGASSDRIRILGRSDDVFIAGGAMIFPIDIQAACDKYGVETGTSVYKMQIEINRLSEEQDLVSLSVSTDAREFDLRRFARRFEELLVKINSDFRNAVDYGAVKVVARSIEYGERLGKKVTIRVADTRSARYLADLRKEKFMQKFDHRSYAYADAI